MQNEGLVRIYIIPLYNTLSNKGMEGLELEIYYKVLKLLIKFGTSFLIKNLLERLENILLILEKLLRIPNLGLKRY